MIRRKKKRLLAERNFEINSKCDLDPATTSENRLVGDQNGARGGAFVFGNYPARRSACEAIAVHNVKVLLGIPSTLSETIARFQALRAMLFAGSLGSNVFKIGRVLKSYGIKYKRIFRKRRLGTPGIFIISFWNPRPLKNGIHTVALTYDGNEYKTYNLYGNGQVYPDDPTVYGKRLITGYRILNSENGDKL